MKKKYIIYSIVIVITIIQCYILLKYTNNSDLEQINITKEDSITEDKNAKNIKAIKNDFSNYKTLTILSYNKMDDGSWKLKCILKGNKEDVIKDIEEIKNYEIIDYSLSYENKIISVEADIKHK
ncbi:MAG: hypothetical protein E7212_09660 [Clostridium sartagoforme]|nr:hypothetical protein [Clostridium sartagoforme]